jgi:hypothetical protein
VHENPLFSLTSRELFLIRDGLKDLEKEMPKDRRELSGKRGSIVRTVQGRVP